MSLGPRESLCAKGHQRATWESINCCGFARAIQKNPIEIPHRRRHLPIFGRGLL